jgi:D-alanine-D-alanine ligase
VVKPVAEGSSKGVGEASVVQDEAALRRAAAEVVARYRQPALVEKFLPGREFTVALLGERKPRVLPPLEVVFRPGGERFPLYSYNNKFIEPEKVDLQVPAKVDLALGKELERAARGAFRALDCRDVSRIDFRLDGAGRVAFVECNPLPGLTPRFSDMCLIAEAAGMDFRTLIGEILAPAIHRFRAQDKQRVLAGRP